MDNLDGILKTNMISSYENNVVFRWQLFNIFNNHSMQNVRYHIMWLFFHSFSFAYPDNPSEEYKIETANFISNVIAQNLGGGCSGCQNDYRKYISKCNIFRIVSSKLELSTFFVDLHNHINNIKFETKYNNITPEDANKFIFLKNNKNMELLADGGAKDSSIVYEKEKEKEKISAPVFFNYKDVKNMYEQTDYISLLEAKFGINIFNLINNKSLSLFYDYFNKINLKMPDVQYNISFRFT